MTASAFASLSRTAARLLATLAVGTALCATLAHAQEGASTATSDQAASTNNAATAAATAGNSDPSAGASASAGAGAGGGTSAAPADANQALLQRGAYLARAGDCVACHTAAGGQPFAGGLAMQTPFGTIYSTNITPDKDHGIGDYSFEDFQRALRRGVGKREGHLYPAMPYASFQNLRDDDLHALYAYFMQGVQPVAQENHKNALSFPFNMRWLMFGWNLLFLKNDGPYKDDSKQNVEWNRGAYLVQGLGHCGACHTPHGMTGQEKAYDHTGSSGDLFLSGSPITGWYAPSLRAGGSGGIGAWSAEDIATFLKTGRNQRASAFGGMTEVVDDSTQYMSDGDLHAIGVYLKSLPEKNGAPATAATASSGAAASEAQASVALRSGQLSGRGSQVYLDSCNACHRSSGTGSPPAFPTLAGNSIVNAPDPTSVIRIVLAGGHTPATASAPTRLSMPDFAWRLNDAEVADVVTFIRTSWGNTGTPVEAATVAKLRSSIGAPAPRLP